MILPWMLPAVAAAAVLGGALVVVRPLPWLGRLLPEIVVLTVVIATFALGLQPLDPGRLGLWQAALWQPNLLGLALLALWAQRARNDVGVGSAHATDALFGGFLAGWLPTIALLAPRSRDPGHAARLAVVATAASACSPLGGPVQLLLTDGAPIWTAWAAAPALVAVVLAWPRDERPGTPGLPRRQVWPGIVGIAGAYALGGLAGVTIGAVVALYLTPRLQPPAPAGLDQARPIRLALAAWVATAFAQVAGVTWGAAWIADAGGQLPLDPAAVAGVAAAGGLLLEPFAAAALAERIAAQPSAPAGLVGLLALPLALSPVPALGIAMASHGRAVWRTGWWATLLLLALAFAWTLWGPPLVLG